MRKKSVLLVCGVFYPEPVVSARIQMDLAIKLAENHKVTVLRPHPTRPKGFVMPDYDYSHLPFEIKEIDSYTCPASTITGRFRESVSHGLTCAKYIRQHHDEIDFIYDDSWHLFGVYLVAKAANRYRIPYITPVQDIYPESLVSKMPESSWLKRLVIQLLLPIDRYSLSHAARIQTNSEKMADYLSETRKIRRDRFVVVRNWQDNQEFMDYAKHTDGRTADAPFTFMYMGNVGMLAGIEVLFDAFSLADLKDARLVIAGSGPAKEFLQKEAGSYSQRIEFWEVPSGKVPEVQSQADVMLLPVKKGSARFSVPSKLVAYMFSAKPIIASVDEDSDTALCVEESGAGWRVAPENATTLSMAFQQAFHSHREVLHKMGTSGLGYASRVFSKERNLAILVKAIEEVLVS